MVAVLDGEDDLGSCMADQRQRNGEICFQQGLTCLIAKVKKSADLTAA